MEPEPMPDHIVQQDIMLDDIKEYRKIISGLMFIIYIKIMTLHLFLMNAKQSTMNIIFYQK